MTEQSSEPTLNSKLQYLSKHKICLVIVFTFVGIIFIAQIFQNSYSSGVSFLQKRGIYIGQTPTSYLKKDSTYPDKIAISYYLENRYQTFTKFRCTGSENDIAAWEGRLCIFYNTCYNIDTNRFHYFRHTQTKAKPLFYDSSKGMIYEFGKSNNIGNFLSLSTFGSTPWSPISVNETYPLKNFTKLHQLHSLVKVGYGSDNIAHGLWEDLGSISYSMERVNVVDKNLIIMHFSSIPKTTLFQTYHQYVLPALTKNPLVEFQVYMKSFNTKYICFDSLIVGGQLSVFPKPRIQENHGREALFYNWRSKIIEYNGFDPNFVPKRHHIIITNKSASVWTRPGTKLHRAIFNLKDVEDFIRLTYPTISTEVIEWHTIPFNKQIEKLLHTTILITPCGGVSLIIPMLPHGAHAIVMDFYTTVAAHGFQPGQSGSMEGAFLNHVAHVRKQYYQIYGRQDYEFDYPGATDAREASSIVVNMTRLQLLIDKALEEMEP